MRRCVLIEVLYFDGCPNHAALMRRLRALLADLDENEPIQEIKVTSHDAAQAQRFLGSPTVRIDGRDIDPSAPTRTDYTLRCRLYPSAEGPLGMPPDDWIIAALTRRAPRDWLGRFPHSHRGPALAAAGFVRSAWPVKGGRSPSRSDARQGALGRTRRP